MADWVFSAETWALIVILFSLILLYGYWPYSVFKRLGVPGPKPLPFMGTMFEYRKGIHYFDLECFQKYGKIWGIYDGRQPVLCIMDPEIIKTILVKECYSLFTNRRNLGLNGPLYDAVTFAEDDDWKRIRAALMPCFTNNTLKEMFEVMKSHSQSLVENLKKTSERGESVDIKECFGAYSMDVVMSTSFGVNINSMNDPNNLFVSNFKKLMKIELISPLILTTALFPSLTPLLRTMNASIFPTTVTDFFYSTLQNIKNERVAQDDKVQLRQVDFMQLMIDSQKSEGDDQQDGKNTKNGLNNHEILSQSMVMIFAGYETTNKSLQFLFYNLASNPHMMKKLQKEIDETFPNKGEVYYDAVMNMDYLDAALNESLRLYPVIFRLQRVCKKMIEIKGLTIPKDTVVVIPTYALHRDPEFWTDPETFNPERFTQGNTKRINPDVYMPYGLGPRSCIGTRLSRVIIKLAAVEILQKFSISLSEETKVPLVLINTGFLASKHPIILKFTARNT